MDKNKRYSWIFAPVRALIIKVVLVVVVVVAIVLVARHYINKVSSTSTPAVITKNEKIDITPSQTLCAMVSFPTTSWCAYTTEPYALASI